MIHRYAQDADEDGTLRGVNHSWDDSWQEQACGDTQQWLTTG